MGLGVVGAAITLLVVGVFSGAAREAGAQLFNSGCWLSAGSLQLGDCDQQSPTPKAAPQTQSTPAPPTPSPGPVARLVAYVPESLRATCEPWTLEGAVAALSCPVTGPVDRVTYRLYAPATRAGEEYRKLLAGVAADGDDCSVGPSDVTTSTGRVGCFDSPVLERVIVWTDDDQGVLAVATSAGASYRDLAGWMATAGRE